MTAFVGINESSKAFKEGVMIGEVEDLVGVTQSQLLPLLL